MVKPPARLSGATLHIDPATGAEILHVAGLGVDYPTAHRALLDWCEAVGLDARRAPEGSPIRVSSDRRTVHATYVETNLHGHMFLRDDRPATVDVTITPPSPAPPWPDDLLAVLTPGLCPACRQPFTDDDPQPPVYVRQESRRG